MTNLENFQNCLAGHLRRHMKTHTREKLKNATNVTLLPLGQAIWGHTWKHTVKQMQPMWYFIFKNPVIGIWVQSRYTSIFRYTAGACQSDRWGSKLDRTLQIVIPNNFGQDQKGPTKCTREPRQRQGGHWQGGRQLLHTRQMPPENSKLRSCSGPCTEFNVFLNG